MAVTTAPHASRPIDQPARSARVWMALARREAGFVLRHPLVLFGVVASGLVLWSMNRDRLPHLGGNSTYVGMGLAPLAGAALLVGHLAASRAHRNQTLEIESTTPAMLRSRTGGRLVGTLAAMLPAALLVVAYMAYLYVLGGTGQPDIGELLIGPLVVGLGAAVGVAAGTWFPNRFSGLVALGGLAGVQIALQDAEGTRHWFAWWHSVLWYGSPDLWIRPTWAHVGYVTGVAILVAGLALLRHGLAPTSIVIALIGAVVVVPAGVVQSRPPTSANVEAAFTRLVEPEASWVTIDRGDVTYHIHPSYERWVDWWDVVLQDTLAPIPPANRPALEVQQWHHAFIGQLEEELGYSSPQGRALQQRSNNLYSVSERITDPWPIRVKGTVYLPQKEGLAIAAALRAVGLPLLPVEMEGRLYTEDEITDFNTPQDVSEAGFEEGLVDWWPGKELGEPRPVIGDRVQLTLTCDAEGQAREVVAAWLAAQASPVLADSYRSIRADGPRADGIDQYANVIGDYDIGEGPIPAIQWAALGWMQRDGFGGGNSGIIGSPSALDLAAQLLDQPFSTVSAAVVSHWQDWTDPATPIQVIIDEFGLEPPPTPEQWLERGNEDPSEYAQSIAAYPRWVGEPEPHDQAFPICP